MILSNQALERFIHSFFHFNDPFNGSNGISFIHRLRVCLSHFFFIFTCGRMVHSPAFGQFFKTSHLNLFLQLEACLHVSSATCVSSVHRVERQIMTNISMFHSFVH
mmetsp:Transcript_16241/g.19469  ORF Transcript_16241/g.19469 Transcript_16241/m.19469 type:complete len:106 (+) Transcript_16241:135-452(+)